jgi:hypothetical protein
VVQLVVWCSVVLVWYRGGGSGGGNSVVLMVVMVMVLVPVTDSADHRQKHEKKQTKHANSTLTIEH